MTNVAVLILAAGSSTRFGSIKQLAKLKGKVLLQHSIDIASRVVPGSIYVVLGANREQISAYVLGATMIVNEDWRDGIGSSIACGIRELCDKYDAVMILLADQPRINESVLQLMLKNVDDIDCTCAVYQGMRGVPAIFPRRYFVKLKGLSGNCGAKGILQGLKEDIVEIKIPEAAFDIDFKEDLLHAENFDWLEGSLKPANYYGC